MNGRGPDGRTLAAGHGPDAATSTTGATIGLSAATTADRTRHAPRSTRRPATTGVTAPTGATGATGILPLSEARMFGTWDVSFSPEDEATAGSPTPATCELAVNCENRSGPHPCDVDAVSPVRGFIQRVGREYEGTVTGDLPCGSSDTMGVAFEVTEAEEVEGVWRAAVVRGRGTILSGSCKGATFDLVGTLA